MEANGMQTQRACYEGNTGENYEIGDYNYFAELGTTSRLIRPG
jgi:hypothetical protein